MQAARAFSFSFASVIAKISPACYHKKKAFLYCYETRGHKHVKQT